MNARTQRLAEAIADELTRPIREMTARLNAATEELLTTVQTWIDNENRRIARRMFHDCIERTWGEALRAWLRGEP